MRIVAALTLLVCVACGVGEPTASADQSADSVFVAALRARLEAATETGQFSGAVLVTRDGRTLYEGAFTAWWGQPL